MTSQPDSPPITDSPWFWFALFSAVGLAALLATGGKFGKRQAGIENRYKARAAVAEGYEVKSDATGRKSVSESPVATPEYSTPNKLEIPLWPLQWTVGAILIASVAMLVRGRRKLSTGEVP
ncbi:hypothetical protein [Adhaeretor mobilis]|uniref:Uncharacterized protein n=1 Tax=Adhaeretor mobilis TaxID=1930276 RepID=A0A517MZ28_9BACT|nr:hypothetical protein [Adhaeretor mobilis]QDT00127.1 hypothetical protein HG15A2_34620 [Adhaeretor mobilis]